MCAVSKFYLTVCLPPIKPKLIESAVAAVLKPYDLNDYGFEPFNPAVGCDWWTLRGRDGLVLRPEYARDRRQLRERRPERRR